VFRRCHPWYAREARVDRVSTAVDSGMRWSADVLILLQDVEGVRTARKQSLTLAGQESAGGNPRGCASAGCRFPRSRAAATATAAPGRAPLILVCDYTEGSAEEGDNDESPATNLHGI
jgi:hypothetical protein